MKLLLTSSCVIRKYPHFFWKSYERNKYTVPEKYIDSKDRAYRR
jgi:ribosomal protein S17E